MYVFVFCFFKQKTAYEMRISDWSSDVCSSDLFSGNHRITISSRCRMGAANTILRPADGLAHEAGRAGRHDGGARACRRRGNARLAGGRERHYLAFSTCRRQLAERSEEHTSELQSLMRNTYAVVCLNK